MMSFKRIVTFVAAVHVGLALLIGWLANDWVGGIIGTLLVYVFVTGFPMMFLAALDADGNKPS
jgi:hypothetical protein